MKQNWHGLPGRPKEVTEPDWDFLEISVQLDPETKQAMPGTRHIDIRLLEPDPDEEFINLEDPGIDWPENPSTW